MPKESKTISMYKDSRSRHRYGRVNDSCSNRLG